MGIARACALNACFENVLWRCLRRTRSGHFRAFGRRFAGAGLPQKIKYMQYERSLPKSLRGLLLLSACAVLMLSACNLFKPVPREERARRDRDPDELGEIVGRRVWNPETQRWEPVRELHEPMDTVRWTLLPRELYPPIASRPEVVRNAGLGLPADTEIKDRYVVAFLLPFMTHRNPPGQPDIYTHSYWALHFYGGARLALEDRESARGTAPLDVYVFDTKASTAETRRLLASDADLARADLIIGPYRSSNVSLVAEYGKRHGKVVVSPWSAATGLTSENEFFVQVNPALETHCKALMRHALASRSDTAEIVVVVRNEPAELARLQWFREAAWEFAGRRDTVLFQEFVVRDTTSDFHEFQIGPMVAPTGETIFIVPSWSNENFIYALLRQLLIAQQAGSVVDGVVRQQRQVRVYGMPQWAEFERVDVDFYEKLQVHISSPFYVDKSAEEVRRFRRRYFEHFGALPRQAAYLGYDLTRYMCAQLLEYGTHFQKVLDQHPAEGLHMRFRFEGVPAATAIPGLEELERVDRYENKALYLLRFREFHFQPVGQ